jgi:hypothetical protein
MATTLSDAVVDEILSLVDRHSPVTVLTGDKRAGIQHRLGVRFYWSIGETKYAASLGWSSEEQVNIAIAHCEGTPVEMLAIGNLLVRITALAESIQHILDAHKESS